MDELEYKPSRSTKIWGAIFIGWWLYAVIYNFWPVSDSQPYSPQRESYTPVEYKPETPPNNKLRNQTTQSGIWKADEEAVKGVPDDVVDWIEDHPDFNGDYEYWLQEHEDQHGGWYEEGEEY